MAGCVIMRVWLVVIRGTVCDYDGMVYFPDGTMCACHAVVGGADGLVHDGICCL